MAEARTEQFKGILAAVPAQCTAVDEGIWRCERHFGEREPFAVVYVDVRDRLPESPEALLGLEEKYIAKGFFEGPKHLKWNHYWLFVVPDKKWDESSIVQARDWIERDTTYARKIVVPDKAVRQFFVDRKWDVESGQALKAPREVWLKLLSPKKLDCLLFSKHRGPAARKWVETGAVDAVVPESPVKSTPTDKGDTGRLAEIRWTKFRQWPAQKHFQFSQVNLISGVNGVGKTSLLEAIELFYCGEIHRGEGNEVINDVMARFQAGKVLTKLPSSVAHKRERDLRWFGAYWRQKQELAKSFNRYIFYNSDAAFQLQQSSDNQQVTSALMNVALGEDATVLWGHIKEYKREIEGLASQLANQARGLRSERDSFKRELAKLTALPMVAEKSLQVLRTQLRTMRWRDISFEVEKFEKELWPNIVSVHEVLATFESLPRGVSSKKQIDESLTALNKRKNRCGVLLRQIKDEESRLLTLRTTQKKASGRADALRTLKQYISNGWLSAWCHAAEDSETLDQLSTIRKQTRLIDYDVLASLDQQRSVATLRNENDEAKATLERELAKVKRRSDQLRERISEIEGVSSEARALATRLIELDAGVVECPLCGHRHEPPGALRTRIEQRRAAQHTADSTNLTELATQIRALQKELRSLTSIGTMLARIEEIIVHMRAAVGVRQNESLKTILDRLQGVDRMSDDVSDRLRATTKSLKELDSKGFDESGFRASYAAGLRGEIKATSVWAEALRDRVSEGQTTASEAVAKISKDVVSAERRHTALDKELEQVMSGYRGEDYEERRVLLEADIEALEEAREHARVIGRFCDMQNETDLRALGNQLARAYSTAKELVSTISEEKVRRGSISSLNVRVSDSEKKLGELKPKLDRADEGAALLAKVMKDHSIEKVLEDFIIQNHLRISSILLDIHAPKEFVGLESWAGGGGIRLIRDDQAKSRCDLTQVSTGQRSAIALAVFLTLNEKVRAAPPLIMLDDPVAQVDDLNMLAFVDYLREIALTSTRQIFFATADDKVAAIVSQKFAALGNDFRAIQLSR